MDIKVSLFASAVRTKIWPQFFASLKSTSMTYEVIFAGPVENPPEFPHFHYIKTSNIKPAQCYEIARRECKGEVVVWVADDCEFPNDVVGKAYNYWKSQNNEKLILSIQTRENGYPDGKMFLFDMRCHTFFGNRRSTPLMAPLAMLSRSYLDSFGGFDKRFVCGQYENFFVMQAINEGAKVEIFGNAEIYIEIDHWNKSKICQEGDFLKRPFATGYQKDREVLEKEFVKDGKIILNEYKFEPYEEKDLLTKSQSNKGQWE